MLDLLKHPDYVIRRMAETCPQNHAETRKPSFGAQTLTNGLCWVCVSNLRTIRPDFDPTASETMTLREMLAITGSREAINWVLRADIGKDGHPDCSIQISTDAAHELFVWYDVIDRTFSSAADVVKLERDNQEIYIG